MKHACNMTTPDGQNSLEVEMFVGFREIYLIS